MFRSTLSNVAQLLVGLFIAAAALALVRPDFIDLTRDALVGSTAAPTGDAATAAGRPGIVALSANPDGHFEVSALINGRHTVLMADTGASVVALTFEDAERLGLRPHALDFNGRITTANGVGRIAVTELDEVTVGPITLHDVTAAVAEPGKLSVNLLGMSFIGRISRFELKGSQLVLHR